MTLLLQRFVNVRREEVAPLLAAAFYFFCVLTALMVLRPARDAIGMEGGLDAIRWLFIGTALVTLAVNPMFGWLVSRFRRLVFITATYAFFAVSLAALGLFWLAGPPGPIMARANRDYLLSVALVLAVALVIERGPGDLLAVESDRLSILHVLLFTLLAGFWSVVTRVEISDCGTPPEHSAPARAYPSEPVANAPATASPRPGMVMSCVKSVAGWNRAISTPATRARTVGARPK